MTKIEVEELLQHAEAAGQSRHARPVAAADLVGRVPALARHALAQGRRIHELEEAVHQHRRAVWGAATVGHDADRVLYSHVQEVNQ